MSTTLYFREGSSDKVYRVDLESRGEGHVVTFAYGRRGSTLNTGTKTSRPVPLEEARRIYDKLVKEKMAKGYVHGPESPAYHDGSRKVTDIRPQLLNAVQENQLESLLKGSTFCMQPKYDGRRLLIKKKAGTVTGINRRGIECGIPESIRDAALSLAGDFIIDGESIGYLLFAFDILQWDSRDLRPLPYSKRFAVLFDLLVSSGQTAICRAVMESHAELKTRLFNQLREDQAEGVVFKRLAAAYCPGRPASGGDHLKYKFVETASVIIRGLNAKRSVAMAVWDNAILVPCGNVTIPADQAIPQVGEVAEVRYLYAMPGSGSLFQPVFMGTRDDIASAECTRNQFKFRREETVPV